MLPTRKSSPAPRRNAPIAAEVKVPDLGIAFGALAASIRADSLFLTTFHELPVGTIVMVDLSLPDGRVVVDGVVVHAGDPAGLRDLRERVPCESQGLGLAIELEAVDDKTKERLGAASSIAPPPLAEPIARVA